MAPLEGSEALCPGSQLGRYQLLTAVGSGGMGKVWAARSVGPRPLQRIVAIKTALSDAAANPEFERLFMDEARIASLIQHPNVCGIQGLDEEGGITYLVMDWSDGGTLRELLDGLPGQKVDPYVAARIVADVCAGLHAAHELEGEDGAPLNVVHRDVSPQNILIASAGHVRIADFGVAKARGQLHRPTETGEMKGKLSYMAPEQVTTKDLDRRVDVFALGCVLYEATLGIRPFHGEDALSTLYQLLEEDLVVPSAVDPAFPRDLERIVVTALAKSPEDRYPTAEAMQHDLRGWLAAERQVVSERTISTVLHQALGKRIAQRQAAIQEAIANLDSGKLPPAHSPLPTETVTVEPSIRSVITNRGGGPRQPALLWAGVAAAAAIGAGVVWIAWHPPSSMSARASSSPHSSALPTPASRPTQPIPTDSADAARIQISVTTDPEHAVLRIDNGPELQSPYRATLSANPHPHTIEVSAPGFAPAREALSFDRNRDLRIALTPLPATTSLPAVGRRFPTARAKGPEAAQTTGTVLAPGPKKTPRQLDEENPF